MLQPQKRQILLFLLIYLNIQLNFSVVTGLNSPMKKSIECLYFLEEKNLFCSRRQILMLRKFRKVFSFWEMLIFKLIFLCSHRHDFFYQLLNEQLLLPGKIVDWKLYCLCSLRCSLRLFSVKPRMSKRGPGFWLTSVNPTRFCISTDLTTSIKISIKDFFSSNYWF